MLVAPDGKDDVAAPEFFKKSGKSIRKAGRRLSRRKARSNNRRKYRLALARLYKKLANQRRDYHFKLAKELCRKYAVICLEDLNMKWMQKGHGRKVMDYGFAEFESILEYEASKTGTQIVKIDKFYPSSQLCHECGYQNPGVKDLSVREWDCPSCGHHYNRDRNAAQNILDEGQRILSA